MTPVLAPMPATMIPTSPRGTMPALIAHASERGEPRVPSPAPTTLVAMATIVSRARIPKHFGISEGVDVELDSDGGEEERWKERVEALHLLLDRVLILGLGDDQAGEERTDHGGQADLGGQRRKHEAEHHGGEQWRLREPRRLKEPGAGLHQPHAAEGKEGEKACCETKGHQDPHDVDAPLGCDSNRDRDQNQSQDVVNHGGAENRPCDTGAERSHLCENGRGDADARGRQGGAQEHGGLG